MAPIGRGNMALNCAAIEENDAIERYLTHQLDGGELDDFEQHLLVCEHCHARLEIYRALRQTLSSSKPRTSGHLWSGRSFVIPLTAAAVVVLGVTVTLWRFETRGNVQPGSSAASTPAPSVVAVPAPAVPDSRAAMLARLSTVTPTPYAPTATRSSSIEIEADYRRAMQAYVERDWDAAVKQLAPLAARPGAPVATNLYVGVAQLLRGQPESARAPLQEVIRAGDTPFLEEARFLLAKLEIRAGSVDAARRELAAVVALDGDRASAARTLLADLDRLPPQ